MSQNNINELSKIIGSRAGLVWGTLCLILYGYGPLFDSPFPWDNESFIYITLDTVKYIAFVIFIFFSIWREVYMIRVKGFVEPHVSSLIVILLLVGTFVGMPFYVENIFGREYEELNIVIDWAKDGAYKLTVIVILAITTALTWKKENET